MQSLVDDISGQKYIHVLVKVHTTNVHTRTCTLLRMLVMCLLLQASIIKWCKTVSNNIMHFKTSTKRI